MAASSTQPVAPIAEALATQILAYCSGLLSHNSYPSLHVELLEALAIDATTTGYLEFGFSDAAIANYFNVLIQSLPEDLEPLAALPLHSIIPDWKHRIFQLQYTHARCCSLLRLAQQHNFFQSTNQPSVKQIEGWQLICPSSFVWLTDTLQFQTNHTTELQIIAHIITVLDALVEWNSISFEPSESSAFSKKGNSLQKEVIKLLTACERLSRAFHHSHKHWQLMGDFRTQPQERQQAHLGLIFIIQRLFYCVLQNQLGIVAPFEL
jgi:hypothetical protein